jgi:hypothetical protein
MARTAGDRGAAVVEMALVAPVLFLVLFGLIEFSGLLRSYSSTDGAVRAAGRVASVAGADPMTDRYVLEWLSRQSGTLGGDAIDVVVIWHATGPGEDVPANCIPPSTDAPNDVTVGIDDNDVDDLGACNVYIRPGAIGGVFATLQGPDPGASFGCEGMGDPEASDKLDCAWPGKNRRVLTTPRNAAGTPEPSDFVGVYLRVKHGWYTGLFGRQLTFDAASIHLIEPQGYSF